LKLIFIPVLTFCLLSAMSCKKGDQVKQETPVPEKEETVQEETHHHAPIDCPLRKHGIDPGKMKPFEETAKYIEFLEREDRSSWQKPDDVVKKIGLKENHIISDVGAGSGYFSFRFSEKVPQGKVYAIDVEPEMIRHIHHRAMEKEIKNIETVLSEYDNPKVPNDSDIVFICDVLHHVQKREEWFAKLFSQMKSGSKLIILDFKSGELPEGPPEKVKITYEEIKELAVNAGFSFEFIDNDILPYQFYMQFSKS